MDMTIKFVTAPAEFLADASDILGLKLECEEKDRVAIRTVMKALIDETEEMDREAKLMSAGAPRIQIQTHSPPETIEMAKKVAALSLKDEQLQKRVQMLARSYIAIAEKNHSLFDEFMKKYGDKLGVK